MIKRFRRRLIGKSNKSLFHNCTESIAEVRKKYESLCLFGSPTQGNWLGIANATKSLYPKQAIEIPQYYSCPVFTLKETKQICDFIISQNFEKVIISGFAGYFFDWIELLHAKTQIEIIFHGTISEFHEASKQEQISKLITFGKNKKVKSFGFVNEGLSEIFSSFYGFNTYHQPLPKPYIPKNIKKIQFSDNQIHIGVFGADTFNKNLHNQVIHALMIDNTIVHVLDKSKFDYLQMGERIIGHGKNLSHDEFLSVMCSMHLNLYMSFNESWGLVAFESEAMGVPCVKFPDVNYLNMIKEKL